MTERPTRRRLRAITHIIGRAAMAVAIGWGYLGVVFALDLAGLASWTAASPFGPLVVAQLFGLFAIMFGATGARIGYLNMVGEDRAKAMDMEARRRREEMRSWGGALR